MGRCDRGWGEVNDHGDVLVAAVGVAADALIDADHSDAVEPVRVVDQDTLALGQDRVVGGVARHRESFSKHKLGTTEQNPNPAAAPDLVKRKFVATAPNPLWVADVTYVPTVQGWLYLGAMTQRSVTLQVPAAPVISSPRHGVPFGGEQAKGRSWVSQVQWRA